MATKTTLQVCLDAVNIQVEDLEDILVTDPMFVDYLNYYLSLPIFSETIQFNAKSGAFEVIDRSSNVLTGKLRVLIRSQRKPASIYKATRDHSYRDIPLIPIDGDEKPQPEEIDTTLSVKVLNKEQSIGWIKRERFPLFLKSDCYLQYRLAKLLSKVKIQNEKGHDVAMVTLPPRPATRPIEKREKEEEEVVKEPIQNDDNSFLESCYVSVGNMSASQTEAWVSKAKMAQQTYPTMSSNKPIFQVAARPISARPRSCLSLLEKRRKSTDSGFASPTKSIMSQMSDGTSGSDRCDSAFEEGRSMTPRPGDCLCVIDDTMVNQVSTAVRVVANSSPGEPEKVVEKPSLICADTDQLALIITATVLKYSIAEVTGMKVEDIAHTSIISDLVGEKYASLSLDDLQRLSITEVVSAPQHEHAQVFTPVDEEESKESDEDVLMNSDDEFDERDDIFRRPKPKHSPESLTRMSRIEDFREFLVGTAGDLLWKLWIDIDRLLLVTENDQINLAVNALRAKYSAPPSNKFMYSGILQSLREWDSRKWTIEHLQQLQRDLARRLILYWAPRYLMSSSRSPSSKGDNLLNNRKNEILTGRRTSNVFPDPKIKTPLPLRPKTCLPRTRPVENVFPDPKIRTPMPHRPKSCLPRTRSVKTVEQIDIGRLSTPQDRPEVGNRRTFAPFALMYAYGNIPPIEYLLERSRMMSLQKSKDENGGQAVSSEDRITSPRPPTTASRFSSAKVRRRPSDGTASEALASPFLGGQRLERMLQALSRELLSGLFFRRYVEKSGNLLWKNCLLSWSDLQDYRDLFYNPIFDEYKLNRLAQSIHSLYIVDGAPHTLRCSEDVQRQILHELDPPFEDLFDAAEEYCLTLLYDAFTQMIRDDAIGFAKVEQFDVARNFHSKNKELLEIQATGLIKATKIPSQTEVTMDGYEDPVYDPDVILQVQEQFRSITMDQLAQNRIELEHFRQFLADNYASMDLHCWMDIEAFRRIPHSDDDAREAKAKMIKTKYLNKKYFFGPNSPAGKDGQNKIMEIGGGWGKLLDDRPPTPIVLEMQKYVRSRLEMKWLPQFLMTPEFEQRQHPPVKMDEVVDDVLVQKRKQSAAVKRMLERKWVSSSNDVITFRKALLNPVTSAQFRRYVSLHGTYLENDVLFWKEVQNYKNMYHLHNEDSAIQAKQNAIIQCFIDSQMPPSLQIDIRTEQADKILDKRRELGPYLFREAQLTVFRVLMPFWHDFCEYRKGMNDTTLEAKLEGQLRRQRAKQKRALSVKEETLSKKSSRSGRSDDGSGAIDGMDEEVEVFTDEKFAKKSAVQWRYSQYLDALVREEVLNQSEMLSSKTSSIC